MENILTLEKPKEQPIEIKKKHPGGRPKRIIKEDEYKVIEMACKIGLTSEQISKLIRISRAQFMNLTKKDKRIKEYWEKGQAETDIFVAGQLLKKIKDGNTACIIFYMKTRMGWKETTKTEVDINTVKPEEIVQDLEKSLFA